MTYDALLRVAMRFGPVVQEPKKTSIHLVADTAFAGVATRRNKLAHHQVRDRDQESADREMREAFGEPLALRASSRGTSRAKALLAIGDDRLERPHARPLAIVGQDVAGLPD
jgi:hypothetical protein